MTVRWLNAYEHSAERSEQIGEKTIVKEPSEMSFKLFDANEISTVYYRRFKGN